MGRALIGILLLIRVLCDSSVWPLDVTWCIYLRIRREIIESKGAIDDLCNITAGDFVVR